MTQYQKLTQQESIADRKAKLSELLTKQCLMVSYIWKRLEVVNYIHSGCRRGLPEMANNKFLYESARVLFSSIITDLSGLYLRPGIITPISFFAVREMGKGIIDRENMSYLKSRLKDNLPYIRSLRTVFKYELKSDFYLRDNDLEEDFSELLLINTLYKLSFEIVEYYGKSGLIEDSNHLIVQTDYADYLIDLIELF